MYSGIKYSVPTSDHKYQAKIPTSLWNKHRRDSPIIRGEYKIVNFGKPGYQQYRDKIGKWSKYDHRDKKRRELYRKRHSKIMIDISGTSRPSYLVPFTAEYFSYNLLW